MPPLFCVEKARLDLGFSYVWGKTEQGAGDAPPVFLGVEPGGEGDHLGHAQGLHGAEAAAAGAVPQPGGAPGLEPEPEPSDGAALPQAVSADQQSVAKVGGISEGDEVAVTYTGPLRSEQTPPAAIGTTKRQIISENTPLPPCRCGRWLPRRHFFDIIISHLCEQQREVSG